MVSTPTAESICSKSSSCAVRVSTVCQGLSTVCPGLSTVCPGLSTVCPVLSIVCPGSTALSVISLVWVALSMDGTGTVAVPSVRYRNIAQNVY